MIIGAILLTIILGVKVMKISTKVYLSKKNGNVLVNY
jgi:hypothetical protein